MASSLNRVAAESVLHDKSNGNNNDDMNKRHNRKDQDDDSDDDDDSLEMQDAILNAVCAFGAQTLERKLDSIVNSSTSVTSISTNTNTYPAKKSASNSHGSISPIPTLDDSGSALSASNNNDSTPRQKQQRNISPARTLDDSESARSNSYKQRQQPRQRQQRRNSVAHAMNTAIRRGGAALMNNNNNNIKNNVEDDRHYLPTKKLPPNFTFRDQDTNNNNANNKPQQGNDDVLKQKAKTNWKLLKLVAKNQLEMLAASGNSSESGSIGGLSMDSQDAAGDVLVDFPTSRLEFMEGREAAGTTVGEPHGNDPPKPPPAAAAASKAEIPFVDESDQRRPWRRNKAPSVPVDSSDWNLSVASFHLSERDLQRNVTRPSEEEDRVHQEIVGRAHGAGGHDIHNRHMQGCNRDDDETSVLSELRLAQDALGWNEDNLNSISSARDSGRERLKGKEPRFQKKLEGRESHSNRNALNDNEIENELDEYLVTQLSAKAATKVAAIRAKQHSCATEHPHKGNSKSHKKIDSTLTVANRTKEAIHSNPTMKAMNHATSLTIGKHVDKEKGPIVESMNSEYSMGRVPGDEEIVKEGDIELLTPENQSLLSQDDKQRERRRHLQRRHRHRQHCERHDDENGEKCVREEEANAKGGDRHRRKGHHRGHRSMSRRRVEGEDSGVGKIERRSKSRRRRSRSRAQGVVGGIDGEAQEDVDHSISRRSLGEDDPDAEAHNFSEGGDGRNVQNY